MMTKEQAMETIKQRINMNQWVKQIRAHALQHYGIKSWDCIVEAFEDEEIIDLIEDANSYKEAFRAVNDWVNIHFSCAEDIRNS